MQISYHSLHFSSTIDPFTTLSLSDNLFWTKAPSSGRRKEEKMEQKLSDELLAMSNRLAKEAGEALASGSQVGFTLLDESTELIRLATQATSLESRITSYEMMRKIK